MMFEHRTLRASRISARSIASNDALFMVWMMLRKWRRHQRRLACGIYSRYRQASNLAWRISGKKPRTKGSRRAELERWLRASTSHAPVTRRKNQKAWVCQLNSNRA